MAGIPAGGLAASVAEARKMGPWCGGVLFFRWPGPNETMAASPDEVLTAAGAALRASFLYTTLHTSGSQSTFSIFASRNHKKFAGTAEIGPLMANTAISNLDRKSTRLNSSH